MVKLNKTLPAFPARQRGVAFITAMLIMVITTIIGVSISERMQITTRRTANIIHNDLAYQYNLGGESWAKLILLRDLEDDSKHGYIDSYREGWSTQLPVTRFDEGTITGQITDLQARFNLNNLLLDKVSSTKTPPDSPSIQYFRRLLVNLELDPDLVYAILDWLDADSNITYPAGSEDEEYLHKNYPYLAANQLMVDVSELRVINGFSAAITAKLIPH
ncbi:MAG: type II secretion system minor pseudopilin GspK, partial [Thioalkalispiraceae bacterium]